MFYATVPDNEFDRTNLNNKVRSAFTRAIDLAVAQIGTKAFVNELMAEMTREELLAFREAGLRPGDILDALRAMFAPIPQMH